MHWLVCPPSIFKPSMSTEAEGFGHIPTVASDPGRHTIEPVNCLE